MRGRDTALLLAALLWLDPHAAAAQCTTRDDASAVQKSAKLVNSCNYRKIRSGPTVTCKTSPAPPCSGSLVFDTMKLAWGTNDPAIAAVDHRLLRDQLSCQKLIGKAAASCGPTAGTITPLTSCAIGARHLSGILSIVLRAFVAASTGERPSIR